MSLCMCDLRPVCVLQALNAQAVIIKKSSPPLRDTGFMNYERVKECLSMTYVL